MHNKIKSLDFLSSRYRELITQCFMWHLRFWKVTDVIGAFGKNFAKIGRVPKQFHRYLITAEKAREDADYGVELEITADNTQETIIQAQEMLDFAEKNL